MFNGLSTQASAPKESTARGSTEFTTQLGSLDVAVALLACLGALGCGSGSADPDAGTPDAGPACSVSCRAATGYWARSDAQLGVPGNPSATGGSVDSNCDGVPDENCRLAVYAADGLQTFYGRDADCDGVAESGCIHRGTTGGPFGDDDDCDGVLERCVSTSATSTTRISGEDADCDGTPDTNCTSTVTRPDGSTWSGGDAQCDGTPDSGCYLAGLSGALSGGSDADCDGVADSRCHAETASVDGIETTIVRFRDDDCDGIGDRDCSEFVSTAGSSSSWFRFDDDCDGVPELCRMHTSIGWFTDGDCDGAIDSTFSDSDSCSSVDYTGASATVRTDSGCDGVVERCSVSVLNGSFPTTSEVCPNHTDCWDWASFDQNGRWTASYSYCEGWSFCLERTYSTDGRLIAIREWEPNESGAFDCGDTYAEYRYTRSQATGHIQSVEVEERDCSE